MGEKSEETEKRIAAILLQSPTAICIDNANGKLIHGDLLESIITEGRADIRILGRSEIVRVHNRSLLLLTGNNPQITGDMARRTISVYSEVAKGTPPPIGAIDLKGDALHAALDVVLGSRGVNAKRFATGRVE